MDAYEDADDIESYAANPISDASNNDANDDNNVTSLSPVVREAYYALAYKKKCVPIIIDDVNLSAGEVEGIAKERKDNLNLPASIFVERTLLVHDDKEPSFFELDKNE